MIKRIGIYMIFFSLGYAESFEHFLQRALVHTPLLKASSIQIDQARHEGELNLRYKNPNVVLESSSFESQLGATESGYRVTVTQPIRLWGVSHDKTEYASALLKSAKAKDQGTRAQFIRDVSLHYLDYIKSKKFLLLGKEEIDLAKKIYDISYERFKAGSISKGKLLQAKVDYDVAQSSYDNLSLIHYEKYAFLLKAAGMTQEIVLDSDHLFKLKDEKSETNSPEQILLKARSEEEQALALVNENSIEWVKIFGEYESEPEQNIMRVGLSFPLAVFNTKSEERRIAKLESQKNNLLLDVAKTQERIEHQRLQHEYTRLEKLKKHSLAILKTEKELMVMFEEGYMISNINLIELQNIKNKVIESEERLITIHTRMQSNIIYQNYLLGNYNE